MTKQYHSRSYHRFFEGYSEKSTIAANGRVIIRRVYTGEYYEPELTAASRKSRRLRVLLSYLGAALLFGLLGSWRIPCNSIWYVAITEALLLISLLWMLCPVFYYLTADEKMTVRIYKESSVRLKNWSRNSACIAAAAAVCVMVFQIMHQETAFAENIICCTGFLGCSAIMIWLYISESRIIYRTSPSEKKIKGRDVKIRY